MAENLSGVSREASRARPCSRCGGPMSQRPLFGVEDECHACGGTGPVVGAPVVAGAPAVAAALTGLREVNGNWVVSRTHVPGVPPIEEGVIAPLIFVGEPARVRVSYSMTLQMRPYESARVEVSLSMPCYPAEIDAVHQEMQTWVSERLGKEREAIEEARGTSS